MDSGITEPADLAVFDPFQGELLASNGHAVRFEVREGTLLSVDPNLGDYGWGFVLRLTEVKDTFTVRPVRLFVGDSLGRESEAAVREATNLVKGEEFVFSDQGRSPLEYRIIINSVTAGRFRYEPTPPTASPSELRAQFGRIDKTSCCLIGFDTNTSVCATSVESDGTSCTARDYFLRMSAQR